MESKLNTVELIDATTKGLVNKMWDAPKPIFLSIRDQIYDLNQWRNEIVG